MSVCACENEWKPTQRCDAVLMSTHHGVHSTHASSQGDAAHVHTALCDGRGNACSKRHEGHHRGRQARRRRKKSQMGKRNATRTRHGSRLVIHFAQDNVLSEGHLQLQLELIELQKTRNTRRVHCACHEGLPANCCAVIKLTLHETPLQR